MMRKAKSNDSSPQKQLNAIKRKSTIPIYPNRESTLTGRYQHSIIVKYNSRIKSFSGVDIKNDCSFIDLSLNNLIDFTNFPSSLLHLTTLILDSNQIRSFHGIQATNTYPKLRFLSIKKNPITQTFYFKIMCLIVFGNQLHSINGEKINDNQRQTANKLRKTAIPHLSQGKIISNINPLKFLDELSEKRQIDHSIGHADNKNSPNSKIKKRKISPKRSLSPKKISEDKSPSVGCLVHMISLISTEHIEKVLQNQIESNRNDSKSSLLNAIIEMKQKINRLKSKYNGNDNFDVDEKIVFTPHQNSPLKNDEQITSEKVNKIQNTYEKVTNNKIRNEQNSVKTDQNQLKINNDDQKIFENYCSNYEQKILIENHQDLIGDKLNENEKKSQLVQNQILKENDTNKNELFPYKIIEDPSVNNEVEMCFDYPEACPFLILDDFI